MTGKIQKFKVDVARKMEMMVLEKKNEGDGGVEKGGKEDRGRFTYQQCSSKSVSRVQAETAESSFFLCDYTQV